MGWARLLRHVFDIDMQHCPNCGGGELKIIAAIHERPVIEKIPTHVGLSVDERPSLRTTSRLRQGPSTARARPASLNPQTPAQGSYAQGGARQKPPEPRGPSQTPNTSIWAALPSRSQVALRDLAARCPERGLLSVRRSSGMCLQALRRRPAAPSPASARPTSASETGSGTLLPTGLRNSML